MKRLSQPEAIVFDTDNTLYPYEPAHAAAMDAVKAKATQRLGGLSEDFLEAYVSARASVKSRLGSTASSHSRLLYFHSALERLGLKTNLLLSLELEQSYWSAFLNAAVLFPGVIDVFHEAKRQKIKLAIVTDLTAQIQFRKLIYFNIYGFFDGVVTSEEVGVDKPDPRAFSLVLEKLEVSNPGSVWMVGDNPISDISGALNQGMIAIQKTHYGVRRYSGTSANYFSFFEYGELLDMLCSVRKD